MIKYQYENKMTSWGYLAMAIGPMRAGKTQWLFHHLTQCADLNRTVLYIGYASDNRTDVNSCNHGITTHSSGGVILSPAITRVKTSYLNELDVIKYDVIGIDEAQFYSDLIPSVTKWLHQGKRIYVAGLDGDYEMKPIGSVLSLIPLATMVTKSSTDSYVTKRCLHCARDIKGTPVGCPTKRTILRRCHKNIISTYEVFHTEGSYCHYNCIWTKLMRSHRGDADSADTCANLLWLCKILHPTETLKLLPDPHYLQCHGGTMTDDEYDRECLQHATHNAVIMTPLMRSSYIIKSK